MRAVATRFAVSVGTVSHCVEHARAQALTRVDFTDRRPGRALIRTPTRRKAQILRTRTDLRKNSVLGEYGTEAIAKALATVKQPVVISRATIYRVLERRGALDAVHRQRRPARPKGWYLPKLAGSDAELHSFDFIEDLKIADGPLVCLLTGRRTTTTIEALLGRWRADGLPDYAQFDNDNVFQGAHHYPDAVGRVTRLCLALGVIPVFAPPREPGLQNAIEGFMACGKAKFGSVITARLSPTCVASRHPTSRPIAPRPHIVVILARHGVHFQRASIGIPLPRCAGGVS